MDKNNNSGNCIHCGKHMYCKENPSSCKKERGCAIFKKFYLNRLIDESGMSGLGKVAEGIITPNGMAVMWWLVKPHSVQMYQSIEDLEWIHGHGQKKTTEIIYEN